MDSGFAGERDAPPGRGPARRAEKAADRRDARAPGRRVADVAIDRWLQASLRSQYDAVIAEPIPEALAQAIRGLGHAGDRRAYGGCPTKAMLTAGRVAAAPRGGHPDPG